MFTVCPKCALTLVVTAADLRIAQGYVRCGRCSSVFNALPHLTDERPPPPPVPSEQPQLPPHVALEKAHDAPGGELPAGEIPDESAPLEETPAEDPDSITGEYIAQPQEESADAVGDAHETLPQEEELEEDPDATGETPALVPPDEYSEELAGAEDDAEVADGELATAVLPHEGLADSSTEDSGSNPVIPEEALEFDPARADVGAVFIAAPPDPDFTAATGTFRQLIALKEEGSHAAGGAVAAEVAAAVLEKPAAQSPQESTAQTTSAAAQAPADAAPAESDAADSLLWETPPAEPSFLARVPRAAWRIGVPLALLLLIVQVIHHNRDALAADARFSRPVTALYGALGIPLVPSWDLHAYDVRQLGAEASPAGSGLITVHASIKNGAAQPQPLPLLRVTLQDRFGNRIAARDVAPHGYLPSAASTLSYLSAGQRIDAQMGFVDPGSNAVGFEIDACLPASAGGIACANDVAAR